MTTLEFLKNVTLSKVGLYVSVMVLLITTVIVIQIDNPPAWQADVELSNVPKVFENWSSLDVDGVSIKERDILSLDESLTRIYRAEDNTSIYGYIGYWKRQTGDSQAAKHSPRMCLPANGWKIQPLANIELEINGKVISVNRILAEINRQKYLYYYFFFNGEDYYTSEWESLLRITCNSLVGSRTDGGIVELNTPIKEDEAKNIDSSLAAERLTELVRLIEPELRKEISRSDF